MKYIYIDVDNNIEAVSDVQLNPRNGFTEIEVNDDILDLSSNEYIKYENNTVIKKSDTDDEVASLIKNKKDANRYKSMRLNAYPNISDQLDMIYHAGLGGDEFQATIQAVKDKYPKPIQ